MTSAHFSQEIDGGELAQTEEDKSSRLDGQQQGSLSQDSSSKVSTDALAEGNAAAAIPPSQSSDSEAAKVIGIDGGELAFLRREHEDMREKMLRALAEADNIQKRMQKENLEARRYALSAFARDILLILDDLHRCTRALTDEEREHLPASAKTLCDGVFIIARSFESTLERHGLQKIEPKIGDKFDPNIHEALVQDRDTSLVSGSISQVMQAGYMISDRLLRPACVGVAA